MDLEEPLLISLLISHSIKKHIFIHHLEHIERESALALRRERERERERLRSSVESYVE